MAIDRNRLKDLIGDIDELFQSFSAPLGERSRQWIETAVMGPAFAELREFIEESRPPVLFLAGRSGHGKSSVINALAARKIAENRRDRPRQTDHARGAVPSDHFSGALRDLAGGRFAGNFRDLAARRRAHA